MAITMLDQVEFSKIPALNFVAPVVTSDPSPTAADEGRIIYNTTTDQFKYCNGTPAWVALGEAGAGGPPSGGASGDLTGSYPGPQITTDAVTNAKLANMGGLTLKGNNTGSAADPLDLTTTQVKGFLTYTKADVGLDQVDNTSDANKPVSSATTTALAGKAATTTDFTAGNGLTGGGTLAANRTFDVGAGTGITVNANDIQVNRTVVDTWYQAAGATAGGDLSGTYPNPQIAAGVIVDADVAAANKDGAVGTPSLRTLAFTSQAAMPGNARLDQLAAPTSSVSLNNQKITGLATPSAASDAATMGYVDSVAQGLDTKNSVRVATTGNITISTALNSGDVIDGITLANGDRVLVKDQSTPAQNGIYVVAASPARATDMDAWTEVPTAYVWVEVGTVNADTGWVCTADQGGTLDSTAMPWTQFSSAGAAIAGAGMTKTGNTLDVGANADNTITVNANDIQVNSTNVEITSRKGQNNGYAALDGSGDVPIAQIPTGTTASTVSLGNHNHDASYVQLATINAKGDLYAGTADNTVGILTAGTNGNVLIADSAQATGLRWGTVTGVNRYAETYASAISASTPISITHNLATRDLAITVYDTTNNLVVQCGIEFFSTNVVKFTFANAYAANRFRFIFVG